MIAINIQQNKKQINNLFCLHINLLTVSLHQQTIKQITIMKTLLSNKYVHGVALVIGILAGGFLAAHFLV